MPGFAEVAVDEVGKDLPVLRRQRVLPRPEAVAEYAAAELADLRRPRSQFLAGRLNGYEITSNDSEVYEKWSQALSSAHDLTYLSCTDGKERTGDVAMSFVVPVVVVPDGRLWVTHFDKDGNRMVDPRPTERCSYSVSRSYFHRFVSGEAELALSPRIRNPEWIEFVRPGALRDGRESPDDFSGQSDY